MKPTEVRSGHNFVSMVSSTSKSRFDPRLCSSHVVSFSLIYS
jgi:hypothetical protein